MRINGVSWTPCVAGVLAVSLLGVGITAWMAAPLAAAAALTVAWRRERTARRTAERRARADAAALQRALRRRGEHLARTVHDLRPPLCTVVVAVELLRGHLLDDRRQTDEVLAEAALAAGHLTNLVDDILDEAAIAAGRLRLTLGRHRVRDLLGECSGLLRLQAERRGVRLEVDDVEPHLAIRTDRRRFAQIVGNLVGNALRAAAAGSSVHVRIEADRQRVRFVVVDRGAGDGAIANGGAGAADTGLGPNVGLQLVRQMGGRTGAGDPDRGGGCWFELPRATTQPGARRAELPPNVVAPMAGAAR